MVEEKIETEIVLFSFMFCFVSGHDCLTFRLIFYTFEEK